MIPLMLACALQGTGDSISLEQALERARRLRAPVAVAAAGMAEARAALRTAGAIPNPTISYSHSESTPTNHLTVDQPLDWLLRRGSDRRAARAGLDRATADSALTLVGLAREVRGVFYRARASRLALELVQSQAALADSVARIAGLRLRAGDISLLEQEQAAQEAARARQAASAARETARADEADLARAIALEGPAPTPAGRLDTGVDQVPDSAVDPSTLPPVRIAMADSAVAAAQARSVRSARVPLPSLTSGAEWGDPTEPGTLAVVGLAFPIPLWNWGGGPAGEAEARADRAAALARDARLDAVRQIRQARIHLEGTASRARFDRDTLAPGAAALRARALRAYQAGETGLLPVLDALRGERDVLLASLQDQLAFQEALADWYALTGRVD